MVGFSRISYADFRENSPEQMEELLANETAFDIYFHSLERVKNLRTFQEELLSGNEQLARKCRWLMQNWIQY